MAVDRRRRRAADPFGTWRKNYEAAEGERREGFAEWGEQQGYLRDGKIVEPTPTDPKERARQSHEAFNRELREQAGR